MQSLKDHKFGLCYHHIRTENDGKILKFILTEFDDHQYLGCRNMLRIGKHLDYLFQLKCLDSPLMASIYHQSREEPSNTLFNIIIRQMEYLTDFDGKSQWKALQMHLLRIR